ncbi:MAG: phosphopentomutase [Syntrophomonadaceae bacterium]|nr:phosphopentomutase [Syntrophomonadaceae bacterium]
MIAIIDRVILVVLDGLGVGELPDAALYGDKGSNTLGNMSRVLGGIDLPNFERLGLGNIIPIEGVEPIRACEGAWGKMAEISQGKDTTTGHWEMMGLVTKRPFPVYPDGFPPDLMEKFEASIGRRTLGNLAASGTAIIEELGAEHVRTGFPIVYTSADSVFQIAAHEDVIPLDELYRICEIARELLKGEHGVGRVIARPFKGRAGEFVRTENRHDYSLEPPGETVLDRLVKNGIDTTGIGKIKDVFADRGIIHHIPSKNNQEGLARIKEVIDSERRGLVFANLVDFDMKYGHRNDPSGYAAALQEVDKKITLLISELRSGDILVFTADHGVDPTTPSTDHSREYVPLLVVGPQVCGGADLGVRETFADLGKTVAQLLGVSTQGFPGLSFAEELFRKGGQ